MIPPHRNPARASFALRMLACGLFALFSMPGAMAQGNGSATATQNHPVRSDGATIPALFVSDIHFDPFHDPGKVKQLAAAPVSRWKSILAAPPSPDQQKAFEAIQSSCRARGVDTPYALLESSLRAMHAHQPDAKFMVVSGDLMAHAFTCRYSAIFPSTPQADYEAFVVKTISFVAGQLRDSFPGMPVYLALGNNDSSCGDYQLDTGNDWLAKTGTVIAEDLPASEREKAAKEFAAGGYYSLTMGEPMKNTRLIVVNDIFLSTRYKTCSGSPDTRPADEQMAWLAKQLQQARESGQRVWVMGHIPPGIDLHATALKFRNVCAGASPVMFLSSEKMADLLVENSDEVKLGIFGHTHMDELRLLRTDGADAKAGDAGNVAGNHLVPVKMTASVSPVDGNNPSFTIAQVNPDSATLEDYAVITASNQTGIGTTWSKEYSYGQTYHEADFSSSKVEELVHKFQQDRGAQLAVSKAYLRSYFVGDLSAALSPFWPEYTCSLDHYTSKGYASCVCAEGK